MEVHNLRDILLNTRSNLVYGVQQVRAYKACRLGNKSRQRPVLFQMVNGPTQLTPGTKSAPCVCYECVTVTCGEQHDGDGSVETPPAARAHGDQGHHEGDEDEEGSSVQQRQRGDLPICNTKKTDRHGSRLPDGF